MPEFALSGTDGKAPVTAAAHGRTLIDGRQPPRPLQLQGDDRVALAAVAAWALAEGHPLITGAGPGAEAGHDYPWDVAFYTSGSTGTPRLFAFTKHQLDIVTGWYATIYRATADSVIVTNLPPGYNFPFVAGLCLAAALGARLHLVDAVEDVFTSARQLAGTHDRCIVLANPVLLEHPPNFQLPDNCLIDTGGAPLSTKAIAYYRSTVADLREGYGLTETCSLTHFDTEACDASLGTVGAAVEGAGARIVTVAGKPRVALRTPALGTPLTGTLEHTEDGELLTGDLGAIDAAGRLRLFGRHDDHLVEGLWPRDVLDHLGAILGTRTALVRHPSPDRVAVRLSAGADDRLVDAVRTATSELIGYDPRHVAVDTARGLLHSVKLPRVPPNESASASASAS
ncbi:MAG: AMP-binding protein [Catenulispora sp.]|nr:AMP-binding protein [Catenulispora sp.]